MQLSDFTPGMRVWSRKWVTYGTVDHPAKKLVHVKMDNTGTIRALPVDDLEIAAQRQLTYIRNAQLPPLPKLKSTRQYPPRDTAPALLRSDAICDNQPSISSPRAPSTRG